MLPRRLDPSGVEAGGESGGEHNLTRKWGGVSGKQWWGCQAPRFHFSLSLFGEGGGVSPGVRHRVRPPPPSGGSLPSSCILAGRLPGPHTGRTTSRDASAG